MLKEIGWLQWLGSYGVLLGPRWISEQFGWQLQFSERGKMQLLTPSVLLLCVVIADHEQVCLLVGIYVQERWKVMFSKVLRIRTAGLTHSSNPVPKEYELLKRTCLPHPWLLVALALSFVSYMLLVVRGCWNRKGRKGVFGLDCLDAEEFQAFGVFCLSIKKIR